MRRPDSFLSIALVHTGVQVICAALVAALTLVLSRHDARQLDVFVSLAQVVGTIGAAKLLQPRATPTLFSWSTIVGLALGSGLVNFALTFFLGGYAAHVSLDSRWAVVAGCLATFHIVVSLRLLIALRLGKKI